MDQNQSKRSLTDLVILFLKGIGMGAADVVPGVSGGTIAFITNIYEELIHSINSVVTAVRQDFIKFNFKQFFRQINFPFLIPLVAGIGTSVLLLSRIVLHLLTEHPVAIWSFFFGLIVASAVVVYRRIRSHSIIVFLAACAGILIAYGITIFSPAQTPESWWFILLSGFIAICAMILPGISGSFILLLLGKYEFILNAVRELKFSVILLFIIGCIGGLAVFSSVLDWLLRKYHDLAVAVLAGFMIGSLNKVWPWKKTIEFFTDSHGNNKPLIEENVMPETYRTITGLEPTLGLAIALGFLGFTIVILLETFSSKNTFKSL